MENTNKQPQTIGEWLDWAEEHGYEWAKEARRLAILYGTHQSERMFGSIKSAVLSAFAWEEAPQGFEYWDLATNI
jgi:hypothetical protein